jgi:hypothetical protein
MLAGGESEPQAGPKQDAEASSGCILLTQKKV